INAVLGNQLAADPDPIPRNAAAPSSRRRALAGFRCTLRSMRAPTTEARPSQLAAKSTPDVFAHARTVRRTNAVFVQVKSPQNHMSGNAAVSTGRPTGTCCYPACGLLRRLNWDSFHDGDLSSDLALEF